MRFQLQARVPYQHSLRWQLNLDYFQAQGAVAFLNQEVPHDITSNPLFARQVAQVLIAGLEAQALPEGEPVRVLELGGGLGDFAYHFLRAFEQLCQADNLPWAERMEYWLTDISAESLKSWQGFPCFQSWLEKKCLRLGQLDALAPETVCEYGAEPSSFLPASFSAVLANYHHCVLPISLLMLAKSEMYEIESELYAWLAGSPQTPASLTQRQAILQRLATELGQWEPESHFEPVLAASLRRVIPQICQTLTLPAVAQNWQPQLELKSCLVRWILEALQALSSESVTNLASELEKALCLPLFEISKLDQSQLQDVYSPRLRNIQTYSEDPAAVQVLTDLTQKYEKAVICYPRASMASLKRLLPLLRRQGMCLLSDKGFYASEQMAGSDWPLPSFHGGSMAQMVNFPFLGEWLHALGYRVAFTADPAALIQTQLVLKGPELSSELSAAFQAAFVAQNANNLHALLLQAGVVFYQQHKYGEALRYYAAARQWGPEDDTSLLFMASTCLALKQPHKALQYLSQVTPSAFQTYTRLLLKAELFYRLQQYAQAIEAYQHLLAYLPTDSALPAARKGQIYLHLGEAYRQLGHPQTAIIQLERALQFLPERTDIPTLIQTLKAS